MNEEAPRANDERHEKVTQLEKLVQRANRVFKVWVLSAALTFGVKSSFAQTSFGVGENPTAATEYSIQSDWLHTYTRSPKFYERLAKEYLRYKEVPAQNFGEFINNPVFITVDTDSTGDTIRVINRIDGSVENIKPDLEPLDDIYMTNLSLISNIFPDIDISGLSESDKQNLQNIISDRLANMEQGFTVVDSIPNTTSKSYGDYDPKTGKVRIIKNLDSTGTATPLHELTHQSTKADDEMITTTKFILKRYAHSPSFYLNDPTEVHARLNVFRYLLEKYGYYDPNTQDFTKEIYEKALEDPRFRKEFNIPQLFITLDEDEIVWFMNNIASLPKVTDKNSAQV